MVRPAGQKKALGKSLKITFDFEIFRRIRGSIINARGKGPVKGESKTYLYHRALLVGNIVGLDVVANFPLDNYPAEFLLTFEMALDL